MDNKKPDYLNDELRAYRRGALKAAIELCYGDKVITQIKQAKTVGEISRIMTTARKKIVRRC